MSHDVFDRLAEWEVPPPPPGPKFERQLHDRLNRALVVLHVVELALRALPWAALQFGQSMLSACLTTLTGKLVTPPRKPGGPE